MTDAQTAELIKTLRRIADALEELAANPTKPTFIPVAPSIPYSPILPTPPYQPWPMPMQPWEITCEVGPAF